MYSLTKALFPQLYQAQQKHAQRICQEITKAWLQQEAHQHD